MADMGPYILGLDIGVASIGWALVDVDGRGRPCGIRWAGVHLFEAGVDGGKSSPEAAMMKGREQSKAKPRRDARAMRRQIWRRARRKKKVLGALIRHGLLPEGDIRTPAAIDAYVKALDVELRRKWEPTDTSHEDRQRLMYRLRAAAASGAVEPHELGRALYHLAQRRGFLSNRKSPDRSDEDRSAMKEAIGELAQKIAAHETPTLGAYLCSVDPDDHRLRGRWTRRQMYLDEFDCIWSVQAAAHGLSDAAREEIHSAIFHQRPLKDQSHLIGRCSLTGRPRCPIGLRIAQRFRILQQVNHLRVVLDDYTERPLSGEERSRLIEALEHEGDLTMTKAKRAAGLPYRGSGAATFSIERGGEKKLVGNRTDQKLRAIFGDRWGDLSDQDRNAVVEDLRCVRDPETLARIGRRRWSLDAAGAAALADLSLEDGHSAHSIAALARLADRMEGGISYAEARKLEFPASFASEEAHEFLPPLTGTHKRGSGAWDRDLRNPSVVRALTELRKLVNAIVRRHGKPERIHVELARDLKSGRSKREKIAKRMRDREQERAKAAEAIARSELRYTNPRGWQIEKWLLAEECGWRCPFTGRTFGARELMGSSSQFDVEHIWPFSRSLDSSFLNMTICYHEENRNRKRGHTPKQAYGGTPEQYEEILERVQTFRGDRFAVREKLRRFTEEIDADFTGRHLTETRYISLLACDYLGLLYGGRVENVGADGSSRRIITPSGGLTWWLRTGWGLNGILSDDDGKNREDHRHHAIDAVVVAIADQAAIKRLADAAQRMEREGRERPFDAIDPPWGGFVDDASHAVESVVVSHRQSRKVRGKLHEDTLYSKEHGGRRRVSKELWKLSAAEVERGKIVDRRALAAIRAKLAELGESNPARAFQAGENLPKIPGAGGRMAPLRRVRVEAGGARRRFGEGSRERYAAPDSNHHMAFYDRKVPGGGVERIAEVVSLPDAADHRNGNWQLVDRTARRHYSFAFSLAPGESVILKDGAAAERLCRVLSISDNDLELIEHTDGRATGDRRQDRIRLRQGALAKANFRKVHVNYLGEVHDAGG
jgi:CRISPR-associated endonuclease Csn1